MSIDRILGDWHLSARPELGGALMACQYKGEHVLRPGLEGHGVLGASAFPMVPFVGRITNGQFAFEGVSHQLTANFLPEPHTIHGFGWKAKWASDPREDALQLDLIAPDSRWPWPIRAQQLYQVDGACLTLKMSLTNLGETAMPAGLGWHPYFEAAGAAVKADITGVWTGEPPHRLVSSGPWKGLGALTPVAGLDMDQCCEWPGGEAELMLGDGIRVSLKASEPARRLTIYAPAGADFFCVEPVTHAPDAVNMADPEVAGLQMLAPGEMLTLEMCITVTS
ncbi:MAG: hypothetical protein MRY64_08100 [Hyphomonadaceae bacterium]|nr:hypothetical protein [Hyphomonadaceae bacterium]